MGLALLFKFHGQNPIPTAWQSPIDIKEVYAITDSGNETLWICEGRSGKYNRRLSDSWAQEVIQGQIPLESHGIKGIPRRVVKISDKDLERIFALPYEPGGKFTVLVKIPPDIATPPPAPAPTSKKAPVAVPESSKALIGMVRLHRAIDVNEAARLLHLIL